MPVPRSLAEISGGLPRGSKWSNVVPNWLRS